MKTNKKQNPKFRVGDKVHYRVSGKLAKGMICSISFIADQENYECTICEAESGQIRKIPQYKVYALDRF